MNDAQWIALHTWLMLVRDINAVRLVVRRGDTTLDPQTMRVESTGVGQRNPRGGGTQAAQGAVTILGDTDLDLQVDDRFTLNGVLYQVNFVQPNRRAAVQASAVVVE